VKQLQIKIIEITILIEDLAQEVAFRGFWLGGHG
jgi:hypothetical protein